LIRWTTTPSASIAGAVGPVGEDDRPVEAVGGPVAGLGEADGLAVVGRVDGDELPARRPVGVGGVEEPHDAVPGGELEWDALGHEDGDDGRQHGGCRHLGGRDVQLPPLLRRAGADGGGEGPRTLDREPPPVTRRQQGAGGDAEVAEDRHVEVADIHGQQGAS